MVVGGEVDSPCEVLAGLVWCLVVQREGGADVALDEGETAWVGVGEFLSGVGQARRELVVAAVGGDEGLFGDAGGQEPAERRPRSPSRRSCPREGPHTSSPTPRRDGSPRW